MSYRCVVVDDEKPARERIKRLLATETDIEVVGEAADAVAAARLIDREKPDLCFLDVQMPEGTGFDVLDRIEHLPQVIFTTAYDQYAVRAFEVSSVDYLLKPFSRGRFEEALARARETLERPERGSSEVVELLQAIRRDIGTAERGVPSTASPERISARRGSRILLLDPAEVQWFEAEDTLVFARTLEGRFLVERTLSELEDQLPDAFFRAHRGYLVNVGRIGEIQPGEAGTFVIRMRDDPESAIPLSRRQARKLKERIPW
jgi:DNA-binding LytR/AlgR family response regulator